MKMSLEGQGGKFLCVQSEHSIDLFGSHFIGSGTLSHLTVLLAILLFKWPFMSLNGKKCLSTAFLALILQQEYDTC